MKIEQQLVYIADDGTVFNTKLDCALYEFKEYLQERVSIALCEDTLDEIVELIINDKNVLTALEDLITINAQTNQEEQPDEQ